MINGSSTAAQPATRYDNDTRVTPRPGGNGYTVTRDGVDYAVLHSEAFHWVICHGPNLDFVQTGDGFAINIADPDSAIDALIGGPQ